MIWVMITHVQVLTQWNAPGLSPGTLLFLVYINFLSSYIQSKCKFFNDNMEIYLKLRSDSSSSLAEDTIVSVKVTSTRLTLGVWVVILASVPCYAVRESRQTRPMQVLCNIITWTTLTFLLRLHRKTGITVDSSLKFDSHILITVKKAVGLASKLLKSTLCCDKDFMITLFKTHTRPLLEFGFTVWNTGYLGDQRLLESTHKDEPNESLEWLISPMQTVYKLWTFTIQSRLIRADLIKCWKIFHNHSSITPTPFMPLFSNTHQGSQIQSAKPHTSL